METTYKIIGGDGREYGPVSLDELKSWIRDGRVGRQTQILRSDLGTWLPASQFQELQSEMAFLKETDTAVTEFEPVGFWPRVAAYVVDQIVLNVAVFLVFGSGPDKVNTLDELLRLMGPQLAGSFLISTVYYVGMVGYFGATLGKMAIGARIVNVDGSKVSYLKAFLRMLASILSGAILCIGYLMVAFREDKRALHDLIVGTRVIYKR